MIYRIIPALLTLGALFVLVMLILLGYAGFYRYTGYWGLVFTLLILLPIVRSEWRGVPTRSRQVWTSWVIAGAISAVGALASGALRL